MWVQIIQKPKTDVMYFKKSPKLNLSKQFTKNVDEIKAKMRRPGVEPGTSAWKAPMLTVTPSTLVLTLIKFGL